MAALVTSAVTLGLPSRSPPTQVPQRRQDGNAGARTPDPSPLRARSSSRYSSGTRRNRVSSKADMTVRTSSSGVGCWRRSWEVRHRAVVSSNRRRRASASSEANRPTTRSSWAGRSALVRSSIAAWRRRSTSASSSGPSDSTSTWPSTLLSRRTSRRSGAGACSRSIRARAAGGGRLLMAGMVVAGSAGEQREPDLAPGVVAVAVEQADPLPGAERRAAADHRHGQRRAGQQREQVVGAVPAAAVAVEVAVVLGQQAVEHLLQVLLGARACLHHDQPGGRVRHEDVQQAVLAPRLTQKAGDLRGQVHDGPAGGVDTELGGSHLDPPLLLRVGADRYERRSRIRGARRRRVPSPHVTPARHRCMTGVQATGAARRGRQHVRRDRRATHAWPAYRGGRRGERSGARRVVGVPGLAGDETGTLATALLASYAVMWAGTTLLLTGGLHLLLLFVRRPLQRFAWVASALVLLAVGAPFTAVTSQAAALAAALINLVAGGVAWVLLLRVGRGAVQDSRRRFLAPPAGGNAARADASASQTGARRPRR